MGGIIIIIKKVHKVPKSYGTSFQFQIHLLLFRDRGFLGPSQLDCRAQTLHIHLKEQLTIQKYPIKPQNLFLDSLEDTGRPNKNTHV